MIIGGIYLNPLLESILIIFVSSGVFGFLLNELYKIRPKLFSFTQKIPQRFKDKWFIKWVIQIFLITMVVVSITSGGFNDILGKIVIGFLFALTDLVFGNSKKIIQKNGK